MTDVAEHSEDGAPRRVLSNGQVLAFIAAQWMRRPRLFAVSILLIVAAVGADLLFPRAAEHLVKAVSQDPRHGARAAWSAWGVFVGVYLAALAFRNSSFFTFIPFAARNMEDLVNDAFRRVQAFSSDWHADTFAGATVRKVSRAMWAYDTVSDQVVLLLSQLLSADDPPLEVRLKAMDAALGPPWSEDYRLATQSAWLHLEGASRASA